MGEFCQQQVHVILPIASRGDQAQSPVAGVTGYGPALYSHLHVCMWSRGYNFTNAVSIKCKLILNFFLHVQFRVRTVGPP